MTSYFADPEFAGLFSSSRRSTAAATAARMIEVAAISPGERVIDLCCGPGLVSRLLAERVGPGGEVIGVDASAAMIRLARENAPAANCRFIQGDAYALPGLVPEPVDCVVATSAWQNFLVERERAADAVHGVLKPGGRFAFDVRLHENGARARPSLGQLRERVIALLRQEYPGVRLQEEAVIVPLGSGRSYARQDIDRDVLLLESHGFRLAARREIEGGPFAGAWYERQRWRADYWLARLAPALSAEQRTQLIERVAAEVRPRLADLERNIVTAYVVMAR